MSLAAAIAQIPNGATVAIGGNTFHRVPGAALHELVRQGKRDLTLVKTAGSYDVDLLAGTELLAKAVVAYVGFETLGMAPRFRNAVEKGRLPVEEHTCASVHAGLRAAIQGVSFMPMAGLTGSDLMRQFQTVTDPYSGQEWAAIAAIKPDWTIIHAHEADEEGNVRIEGAPYDDILQAKAASHVIVTAERIVRTAEITASPERTTLPGFLVDSVVEAPHGAWPHACHGLYGFDEAYLRAYLDAALSDDAYVAFVAAKVVGE
jgi:glutaconate CoA-transferase subunit A